MLFDFAGIRSRDVPAGRYLLNGSAMTVVAPGSTRQRETRIAHQPVSVDRDLDEVRVTFSNYPELRGAITGEDDRVPASLAGQLGNTFIRLSNGDSETAARDGTFHWPSYPGVFGTYLDNLNEDFFVRAIRFQGEDATHRQFELNMSGGWLDFVVAHGAAGITGSVYDAVGQALSVPVTIWGARPQAADSLGFMMTTVSDYEGRFRMSNIPPGAYRIAAWEGIDWKLAGCPGFYDSLDKGPADLVLAPDERKSVKLIAIPSVTTHAEAVKFR